jgi:FkbM family methyltransferase
MFKSVLVRAPFYLSARSAYRAVFKADHAESESRMRAFYAQFFQPGDLVFDVGANQGEYAEAFAREGGRVIAIEPNPAHRARLEALSKSMTVTPEYVAVSDQPGSATLNICSTSGYSTLVGSDSEWMAQSPDYAKVEWVGEAEVQTVRLDDLAAKHGVPEFVKIDIEGFELVAMKGMSFRPRYLSFEYGVRRKEIALDCLDLLGARGYRFRPIDGRDFRFSASDWMDTASAMDWLKSRTLSHGEYGDLFAYRWPK